MPLWPALTPSSAHEAPATSRDHFAPEEISHVLSQYPLSHIESAQEFSRGSRRSPKVIVTTAQGKFLLKRRAPGKNKAERVAFSHAIQLHLAQQHFPLPRLIVTNAQQSFVQYQQNIYELFEFITAEHYPQTLEATEAAGQTLAVYHGLLLDFTSSWHPPTASYHRSAVVRQSFSRIESAAKIPADLLNALRQLYDSSADAGDHAGLATWPPRIVHADWHPGNMLFHGDRIVAVLDFDSARRLPIAIDLANGALQFSMIDGDENASQWPPETDEARYRRFLRGYRSVAEYSTEEARAMPSLMIEALIAEAVFPIAATGAFGRIPGDLFLHMIHRKAQWIADHALLLSNLAEQP